MNKEFEQKLTEILDANERSKVQAEEAVNLRSQVEANNLSDFYQKKDSVIKSALEEIATMYRARDRFASVEEKPELLGSNGAYSKPTILLDLAGPTYRDKTMKPAFALIFDKRTRDLLLHQTTTWSASPEGTIPLDKITAGWIHNEFVKYAAK